MYPLLEIITCLLVAAAMAPALAHVLEMPGKMRLDRQHYFVVQRIYYPGFTAAGIAEPGSILATMILAALVPLGTAKFWLVATAFLAMTAMQVVFWTVTQPVNRTWVKDIKLSKSAKVFFDTERERPSAADGEEWTVLRDRWENSHLIRAALAVLGFVALLLAIVLW